MAEERSFGNAAKRLHLSQPPLSIQIKGLEEEIGVRLLNRTTRRVDLTDAGRAFLDKARNILAVSEEAKFVARGAELGLQGHLEIGFVSTATLSLLPPALRLFRERFTDIELDLKELSSMEQLQALYEGDIRVGLVRMPLRAPEIELEPILEEPSVVALPADHPLGAHDSLTIGEIAGLPLIFFERRQEPGSHEQIVELLARVGALPKVAQYAVHLQTVVGRVASDMGVSILPASARKLRRDGVVYQRLDAPDATTWLGLMWLEKEDSALIDNFNDILREVAK